MAFTLIHFCIRQGHFWKMKYWSYAFYIVGNVGLRYRVIPKFLNQTHDSFVTLKTCIHNEGKYCGSELRYVTKIYVHTTTLKIELSKNLTILVCVLHIKFWWKTANCGTSMKLCTKFFKIILRNLTRSTPKLDP